MGEYNQVIGRARRLCSHKQLAYPGEWTVDVHSYIAKPNAICRPNTTVVFKHVENGHVVEKQAVVVDYDADNSTYSLRFPPKRTVRDNVFPHELTGENIEGPDERNLRLREERTALITDVYDLAGSVSLDCTINQVRTDFNCVDWSRPDVEAMAVDDFRSADQAF